MAARWNFRPIPDIRALRFTTRKVMRDEARHQVMAREYRQPKARANRHASAAFCSTARRLCAKVSGKPSDEPSEPPPSLVRLGRPQPTALQPAKEGGEPVAAKSSSKTGASSPRGSSQSRPTAALDPATIALTAKGIYEAAKAGVDVSVRLYEATRGEMAMVGAVLASLCPHAIVVNAVLLGSPKGAPIDVFLLRPASSRIGWEDDVPRTGLEPPVAGKTALQIAGPFLIPPLRAQEIVVEADRASVLSRIYNKRGGTILVSYNVLGDNGDPRELKIEILLRDDQPMPAGLSGPTT
jgi:hypothetical protein